MFDFLHVDIMCAENIPAPGIYKYPVNQSITIKKQRMKVRSKYLYWSKFYQNLVI